MTLFKEIIAFLFPNTLKFYWPFLQNFLFLKPNFSSWPCLQSFLFLSLVPDTKTRMLGVILDSSTPTIPIPSTPIIPIRLQDSLDSFLICFLKIDPFIFVSLIKKKTNPHGLMHDNRFIIGISFTNLSQLQPIVACNARWIWILAWVYFLLPNSQHPFTTLKPVWWPSLHTR